MKNYLSLLVASAFLLGGCSSAFKASQTPDDVYYSYGNEKNSAIEAKQNAEDEYVSYWGAAEENYLRMKVRDSDRWSSIDDLNYWYGYDARFGYNNPYMFNNWSMNNSLRWNLNYGSSMWMPGNNSWYWNNPFSWGWNSFYNSWNNPYCWNTLPVVVNKFPTNSALNTVTSSSRADLRNYYNTQYQRGYTNSVFDQKGNRFSGYSGDTYRSVNNGSNNNSSWSRPSRTFEGSSSSSSSGSTRTSGSSSSSSSSSSGRTNSRGGN